MPRTSNQDFFAVFGLDRRMNLARADLEYRFYTLSRKLHPDNFYRASKEEQESSLDQSARLNDAYRTLRDPVTRAEYLLSLEGQPAEKKRSGVPPGTQYHWYIMAHQRVRKLDQDAYETFMEGVKYKVAHKRPHWRGWSTDYPDQEPERAVLIRILEEQLAELKSGVERQTGGKDSPSLPAHHRVPDKK